MKAAVLTKLNSPLVIADVEPTDLSYGQVYVRVLASGICGAQLQEISGDKGNEKFLPHLLGHEGCGVVEYTGGGVKTVKPGDKVVMHWRVGEGIESNFPKYHYDGKIISSGKITTFSEYSIVSENRLTKVPTEAPVELCALLGCGLSTALGTIEHEAKVKFGESVLVIGVGGLGVNLITAAKLACAYPVIAVDICESKRELALASGADIFFHVSQKPWEQGVEKVDVVIDTSGNAVAIEHGIEFLAPSGRFIMVGQPKPFECVKINHARNMFLGEGKTIKATQGGGFRPHLDVPRYIKLHQSGKLKLDAVISDRIPLADINRGLDLVRQGKASRVMIEMT